MARYDRKGILASQNWSNYQLALFDAVKNSDRNILVGAVAGSGKTTSIEAIVASCDPKLKVAVLTFNKHIAEELKTKIPSSAVSSTAHAYGKTVLVRHFEGALFEIDDRKYQKITRDVVLSSLGSPSRGLVYNNVNRYILSVSELMALTLSESNETAMRAMIEHYCIEMDDIKDAAVKSLSSAQTYAMVSEVLARGLKAAEAQKIGLTDLIWLPNVWDLVPPQKDLLIIDEAQDANAAMRGLYQSIIKERGRIVIVGDEKQAIMGFGGSDAYSWEYLKKQFQPLELPLSVCYRCPSTHLDLARQINPEIQDADNAVEGEIILFDPANINDAANGTDLVLCRFKAPLVKLCIELTIAGRTAKIRGNDIGKDLSNMVRDRKCGLNEFLKEFNAYCYKRLEIYAKNDRQDAIAEFADKQAAVLHFWDAFGAKSTDLNDFASNIDLMFCDGFEDATIILSTIHRAKGSEADNVFLLGCNSLPFVDRCKHDWQIQQEINLQYVALTRAKKKLFLVPLATKAQTVKMLLNKPLAGMSFMAVEMPEIEIKAEFKEREFYLGEWQNLDGLYGRVVHNPDGSYRYGEQGYIVLSCEDEQGETRLVESEWF